MMNKYRNKHCEIDGHKFPSMAEGKRYRELKFLEMAGEIKDLKLQPRFQLKMSDEIICSYVGDFSYVDNKDNYIVEDVKGVSTAVFKLKRKMMKAYHGIKITEIH